MSHKIESITQKDGAALQSLFAQAGPYVTPRGPSDYWAYARFFGNTCLCARDSQGDLLAATIAFCSQIPGSAEIYIQDVAVDPNSRRSGLAVALLNELRVRATEMSVESMWLTSDPENKVAQRLWDKFGFLNKPADYRVGGIWVSRDLKGPGRDRVVYELRIG